MHTRTRSIITVSCVDAPKLDVAVYRQGHGSEAVWFIHGLGADHDFWQHAPRYFAPDRYSLFFVDLPGFGASEQPDTLSYTMPTFADCLRQVIQHFPAERWHLVAHSMGGIVALLLADTMPNGLGSLTLAEGNLVGTDAFMSGKIATRSESAFVKNYEFWTSILPSFMTDESEAVRQRYCASLRQASAIAMHRASKSCAEWSQTGKLASLFARLTCPRAYVVGEKTRQRRALPEVVMDPAVTRFEIEGQGHFMMENAEGFYAPLARWMGSLSRP
jgi:pimeloyl-ACP methyl ester carboxylesterase